MKEFGCVDCGFIIKGVSPDDFHIVFSINKLNNNCIKTTYKCEDCGKEAIRYWCKPDSRRLFYAGLDPRYNHSSRNLF